MKNRGFTLIEIMITIAIIGILGAVAVSAIGNIGGPDAEKAIEFAQEYGQNFPNYKNAQCVGRDSDGDGFCSCTLFMTDGTSKAIECGCERRCWTNCANGCKLSVGKTYYNDY